MVRVLTVLPVDIERSQLEELDKESLIETAQVDQLPDLRWQRAQLVEGENEPGQVGLLPKFRRQRAQVVETKAQFLPTFHLGLGDNL